MPAGLLESPHVPRTNCLQGRSFLILWLFQRRLRDELELYVRRHGERGMSGAEHYVCSFDPKQITSRVTLMTLHHKLLLIESGTQRRSIRLRLAGLREVFLDLASLEESRVTVRVHPTVHHQVLSFYRVIAVGTDDRCRRNDLGAVVVRIAAENQLREPCHFVLSLSLELAVLRNANTSPVTRCGITPPQWSNHLRN